MTPFLDICEVERIDHGNDDLTVVNAARVSNAKRVDSLVTSLSIDSLKQERHDAGMGLDDGLIRYLANNAHWTPFAHARHGFDFDLPLDFDWTLFLKWSGNEEKRSGFRFNVWGGNNCLHVHMHGSVWGWLRNTPPIGNENIAAIFDELRRRMPWSYEHVPASIDYRNLDAGTGRALIVSLPSDSVTFRVKMPLFVARQLMRSNVGIVYNETSRRYVDGAPEYHEPEAWRGRPDRGIKQGSGADLDEVTNARIDERYSTHVEQSDHLYRDALGMGVAPEMARMVLPQSMVTELWMTCTHEAVRRILKLRLGNDGGKNHPQREITELAVAMSQELPDHFPRG